MKRKKRDRLRLADIIVILGFLAAAVLLYLLFGSALRGTGDEVLLRVDGAVVGAYSLQQDCEIPVETPNGQNRFQIANGSVSMIDADCPDGYCVKSHSISKDGETIVCLPHRVVLEIRASARKQEVDAVAQ